MSQYAHRLSTTTLTLKDAQGRPMPGRKVEVDLTRHEFLFGSGCFWLQMLLNPLQTMLRRLHKMQKTLLQV